MGSMLSLRGVEAAYGPAQALFGVEFDLSEGEMVALLGRNGMGKTTTIGCVFGLLALKSGEIRFANRVLNDLKAHRRARLGLGLVPEGRRCFAPLTVEENILAAARSGPRGSRWRWPEIAKLFPRLEERRTQQASTLSGGEQQMLSIGRALATNPVLLALDEATEGLAPTIRAEIWSTLRQLKDEGLSILVVDKMLAEVLPVADRCVVLEKGATVWSGAASTLGEDVRDRYLGV